MLTYKSFSVGPIGPRGAALLVTAGVLAVAAPLLLGLWYLLGGGWDVDARIQLERLVAKDPVATATEAIADGDLRLWVHGSIADRRIPGSGTRLLTEWEHGFRQLPSLTLETPEDRALDAAGVAYATAYNRVLIARVPLEK